MQTVERSLGTVGWDDDEKRSSVEKFRSRERFPPICIPFEDAAVVGENRGSDGPTSFRSWRILRPCSNSDYLYIVWTRLLLETYTYKMTLMYLLIVNDFGEKSC